MYKVKALVGGTFCLNLENGGSVNIRQGHEVNLEQYCSRKWIETDPEFRSLVNRRIIMVVFDSATAGVPPVNLISAVPRKPIVTPHHVAATNAARARGVTHVQETFQEVTGAPLDLPKPTSDTEPVVIDVKTKEVTEPKKGVLKVKAQKPTKKYTEAELRKMYLGDIKVIAAALELDVSGPTSKNKLIQAILDFYKG
jgi:hypothetical protein